MQKIFFLALPIMIARPWAASAATNQELLNQSNNLWNRRNYKSAIALCRRVYKSPKATPAEKARALYILGGCNYGLRRYKEALPYLNELLKKYPEDKSRFSYCLGLQAYSHYRVGNYNLAIASYERLIKEHPDNKSRVASACYYLGYCYSGAKNYEKAVETFQLLKDKYLPYYNYPSTVYSQIGYNYEYQRKYEEAIRTYREFIEKYPGEIYWGSQFMYRIGATCYHSLRRYQEEAEVLLKMPDRFPQVVSFNQAAHLRAALAYRLAREYEKAIETCNSYLARYPDPQSKPLNALREMISCYRAMQDEGGVRKVYARIAEDFVELGSVAADAKYQIGLSFHREKKWEETIRAFQELLVEFPDQAEVCVRGLRMMLRTHQEMNRQLEALAVARVLLFLGPPARERKERSSHLTETISVLQASGGSSTRVNDFFLFQRYGPNGMDGKPNTEDDVSDPLAGLWLQFPKDLKQALKAKLVELEGSPEKLETLGYVALYLGDKVKSLEAFEKAFAIAPTNTTAMAASAAMVRVGLKAATGNIYSVENFNEFLQYGPQGKDGLLHTEDDVPNPVKAQLK